MNNRTHVVHVIYALQTGGLENGLVNLIQRLPSGLYRHSVVCITKAGNFSVRLPESVAVYELDKKPGKDLGVYARYYRLIRTLDPDVIHTRNIAALATVPVSWGMRGVCRVHSEHGRDIFEINGENAKYNLLRKVVFTGVDKVVTVSKDLQSWLIRKVGIHPDKVVQIYNGVDTGRFFPGKSLIEVGRGVPCVGKVVLGTVGRLAQVKNQALLIRAFALLKEKNPTAYRMSQLMLVGDGPLRAEYMALSERLYLRDKVWFAGDRDDVPDLLRAMDVFILPSLAEGISNTILEAMATGIPVIATATGGNVELVEHGINGLLVRNNDAEDLAMALSKLILNKAARESMGRKALQKMINAYSWEKTVESYHSVYRRH